MYQHILLPTDGSELSAAAIRSGLQLAKLLGARVTGLSVVVEPLVAGGLGEVMRGRDEAVARPPTPTSPRSLARPGSRACRTSASM